MSFRKFGAGRRGVTIVQVALVLALIAVAVLASARLLGTRSRTSMNTTAGNIANPSTLPSRFGS